MIYNRILWHLQALFDVLSDYTDCEIFYRIRCFVREKRCCRHYDPDRPWYKGRWYTGEYDEPYAPVKSKATERTEGTE
jgi:hypothetical protein